MPPSQSIADDAFSDLDIPPQLEESIRRHRIHLAEFMHNLKNAGISEKQMEASLSLMISSYRDELIRTIKEMVR